MVCKSGHRMLFFLFEDSQCSVRVVLGDFPALLMMEPVAFGSAELANVGLSLPKHHGASVAYRRHDCPSSPSLTGFLCNPVCRPGSTLAPRDCHCMKLCPFHHFMPRSVELPGLRVCRVFAWFSMARRVLRVDDPVLTYLPPHLYCSHCRI